MIVFGITGGSGSGKTSVSKMLEKLGVHIIDTDVIAHEIVEPNSDCLNELVNYFGDSILNDDKTLNRKKLASIAFSDKQKTVALSNITHKYIKAEVVKDINTTDAELVGIDGAVIIGSNVEPLCEFIVSVIADKQSRITRVKTRGSCAPMNRRYKELMLKMMMSSIRKIQCISYIITVILRSLKVMLSGYLIK